MKFSYINKHLDINGNIIETSWAIREAFELDNRLIVLLDRYADLPFPASIDEIKKRSKGRTLLCYSPDGTLLWEAENPEGGDKGYYHSICSKKPLQANSFSSGCCEIDINTGKIISKYIKVDSIIQAWVNKHGFHLCTRCRDEEFMSVDIYDMQDREYGIGIEPPDSNDWIKINAYAWDSRKRRKSYYVAIEKFQDTLEEAVEQINLWMKQY